MTTDSPSKRNNGGLHEQSHSTATGLSFARGITKIALDGRPYAATPQAMTSKTFPSRRGYSPTRAAMRTHTTDTRSFMAPMLSVSRQISDSKGEHLDVNCRHPSPPPAVMRFLRDPQLASAHWTAPSAASRRETRTPREEERTENVTGAPLHVCLSLSQTERRRVALLHTAYARELESLQTCVDGADRVTANESKAHDRMAGGALMRFLAKLDDTAAGSTTLRQHLVDALGEAVATAVGACAKGRGASRSRSANTTAPAHGEEALGDRHGQPPRGTPARRRLRCRTAVRPLTREEAMQLAAYVKSIRVTQRPNIGDSSVHRARASSRAASTPLEARVGGMSNVRVQSSAWESGGKEMVALSQKQNPTQDTEGPHRMVWPPSPPPPVGAKGNDVSRLAQRYRAKTFQPWAAARPPQAVASPNGREAPSPVSPLVARTDWLPVAQEAFTEMAGHPTSLDVGCTEEPGHVHGKATTELPVEKFLRTLRAFDLFVDLHRFQGSSIDRRSTGRITWREFRWILESGFSGEAGSVAFEFTDTRRSSGHGDGSSFLLASLGSGSSTPRGSPLYPLLPHATNAAAAALTRHALGTPIASTNGSDDIASGMDLGTCSTHEDGSTLLGRSASLRETWSRVSSAVSTGSRHTPVLGAGSPGSAANEEYPLVTATTSATARLCRMLRHAVRVQLKRRAQRQPQGATARSASAPSQPPPPAMPPFSPTPTRPQMNRLPPQSIGTNLQSSPPSPTSQRTSNPSGLHLLIRLSPYYTPGLTPPSRLLRRRRSTSTSLQRSCQPPSRPEGKASVVPALSAPHAGLTARPTGRRASTSPVRHGRRNSYTRAKMLSPRSRWSGSSDGGLHALSPKSRRGSTAPVTETAAAALLCREGQTRTASRAQEAHIFGPGTTHANRAATPRKSPGEPVEPPKAASSSRAAFQPAPPPQRCKRETVGCGATRRGPRRRQPSQATQAQVAATEPTPEQPTLLQKEDESTASPLLPPERGQASSSQEGRTRENGEQEKQGTSPSSLMSALSALNEQKAGLGKLLAEAKTDTHDLNDAEVAAAAELLRQVDGQIELHLVALTARQHPDLVKAALKEVMDAHRPDTEGATPIATTATATTAGSGGTLGDTNTNPNSLSATLPQGTGTNHPSPTEPGEVQVPCNNNEIRQAGAATHPSDDLGFELPGPVADTGAPTTYHQTVPDGMENSVSALSLNTPDSYAVPARCSVLNGSTTHAPSKIAEGSTSSGASGGFSEVPCARMFDSITTTHGPLSAAEPEFAPVSPTRPSEFTKGDATALLHERLTALLSASDHTTVRADGSAKGPLHPVDGFTVGERSESASTRNGEGDDRSVAPSRMTEAYAGGDSHPASAHTYSPNHSIGKRSLSFSGRSESELSTHISLMDAEDADDDATTATRYEPSREAAAEIAEALVSMLDGDELDKLATLLATQQPLPAFASESRVGSHPSSPHSAKGSAFNGHSPAAAASAFPTSPPSPLLGGGLTGGGPMGSVSQDSRQGHDQLRQHLQSRLLQRVAGPFANVSFPAPVPPPPPPPTVPSSLRAGTGGSRSVTGPPRWPTAPSGVFNRSTLSRQAPAGKAEPDDSPQRRAGEFLDRAARTAVAQQRAGDDGSPPNLPTVLVRHPRFVSSPRSEGEQSGGAATEGSRSLPESIQTSGNGLPKGSSGRWSGSPSLDHRTFGMSGTNGLDFVAAMSQLGASLCSTQHSQSQTTSTRYNMSWGPARSVCVPPGAGASTVGGHSVRGGYASSTLMPYFDRSGTHTEDDIIEGLLGGGANSIRALSVLFHRTLSRSTTTGPSGVAAALQRSREWGSEEAEESIRSAPWYYGPQSMASLTGAEGLFSPVPVNLNKQAAPATAPGMTTTLTSSVDTTTPANTNTNDAEGRGSGENSANKSIAEAPPTSNEATTETTPPMLSLVPPRGSPPQTSLPGAGNEKERSIDAAREAPSVVREQPPSSPSTTTGGFFSGSVATPNGMSNLSPSLDYLLHSDTTPTAPSMDRSGATPTSLTLQQRSRFPTEPLSSGGVQGHGPHRPRSFLRLQPVATSPSTNEDFCQAYNVQAHRTLHSNDEDESSVNRGGGTEGREEEDPSFSSNLYLRSPEAKHTVRKGLGSSRRAREAQRKHALSSLTEVPTLAEQRTVTASSPNGDTRFPNLPPRSPKENAGRHSNGPLQGR